MTNKTAAVRENLPEKTPHLSPQVCLGETGRLLDCVDTSIHRVESEAVSASLFADEIRRQFAEDLEPILARATRTAREETLAEIARALTPMAPVPAVPNPNARPAYGAYAFDRPITFSTPQSPARKPLALASTDTLRALADNYDILRACINELRREVLSVPIEVVARDPKDTRPTTRKRLEAARALFANDGAIGGVGEPRRHFESKLIEDLCVIGAGAIFHERAGGGWVRQSVAIDAATIRPFVDAYGWAPSPGEPGEDNVYEQWVYGVQVARFGRADLTYDGIYPTTYSPYFKSPVEYLLDAVDTALRSNMWNKGWLTDGNSPDDAYALPENWQPEQIKMYAEWWDSLTAGGANSRHKTRFLPSGSQRVGARSRKDQDFAGLDLWLVRRTCAIMGVQPASIGFAGEQYKVSQESSVAQTTAFGAGVILGWRKDTYDDLLSRHGFAEFECRNVTDRQETAQARAVTNETLIRSGQRTPNECRQADGEDPLEGGDVLLVPATLIPLTIAGLGAPGAPKDNGPSGRDDVPPATDAADGQKDFADLPEDAPKNTED